MHFHKDKIRAMMTTTDHKILTNDSGRKEPNKPNKPSKTKIKTETEITEHIKKIEKIGATMENTNDKDAGIISKDFLKQLILGILIAGLTAYLTVYCTRADSNNQVITETKTKLDSLEKNTDKNFVEVKAQITDLKADTNKRFDKIDDKLDKTVNKEDFNKSIAELKDLINSKK